MVGTVFKVVVSKNARDKLKKISDYYTENASPEVAKKVRTGLVKETKSLSLLPDSKPLLQTKGPFDPPFIYTKKWSFKIIFQVFHTKEMVHVAEYLHDKEDPNKWDQLKGQT